MVDLDIIYEKINSIQNCLQRIKTNVGNNLDTLHDLNTQDIVVLNLQRAVQLVIDIAAHVVNTEKMGLPKNLKDTFRILHQNKIIDDALTDRMERMVGFRNIAVHDYQSIEPEILKAIVKNHLSDLEKFYTIIFNHYKQKI